MPRIFAPNFKVILPNSCQDMSPKNKYLQGNINAFITHGNEIFQSVPKLWTDKQTTLVSLKGAFILKLHCYCCLIDAIWM